MLIIYFKDIKKILKNINKKTWIILGIVFILALSLRIFIPAHYHSHYGDESFYMKVAKDISQNKNIEYNEKSIGWPMIMSLIFSVIGNNNYHAIYTNIFIGSLSCVVLFFLVLKLFNNKKIALVSSILLSINQLHILWSTKAENIISSLFFILVFTLLLISYFKDKKLYLLNLAIISATISLLFRRENYLLIPVIFLIVFIIYEDTKKDFLKRIWKNKLLILFIILLSAPNFTNVFLHQFGDDWTKEDSMDEESFEQFSLNNLVNNSQEYWKNVFAEKTFPIISISFFLAGLILIFLEKKKEFYFTLVVFVLLWITYFSSWLEHLGSYRRIFISFVPIITIPISYLIHKIGLSVSKLIKTKKIKPIVYMTIITLMIAPFFSHGIEASHTKYDSKYILETKILEIAKNEISQECSIYMVMPVILQATTNFNVIETKKLIQNPTLVNQSNCNLFLEDLFCLQEDKTKQRRKLDTNCKEELISNGFNLVEFKKYKEKDVNFTFYEIN
jgi:4-amino-4-deoxy-L-arabinose transferase-like glycosyltransferase